MEAEGINPVTGKFGVVVTAPPNSGKDIIVSFCCRKRMTEREEERKALRGAPTPRECWCSVCMFLTQAERHPENLWEPVQKIVSCV